MEPGARLYKYSPLLPWADVLLFPGGGLYDLKPKIDWVFWEDLEKKVSLAEHLNQQEDVGLKHPTGDRVFGRSHKQDASLR